MDIPVELLGPYAKQYQAKQQEFVSKGAVVDKRKSTRANFTALYKKPNHKFLQDPDARRQGRQQQLQERRRTRRSSIMNNFRGPMMAQLANGLNKLIQDDSSNEISALDASDAVAIMGKMEISKDSGTGGDASRMSVDEEKLSNGLENSNGGRNITVESVKRANDKNKGPQNQNRKPAPPTINESRRDQLQKWKKQKEAASKVPAKQPFKVGAPVTTKPVKAASATCLVKSASSTINSVSLPKATVSVTGTSNNSKSTTAAPLGSRQPVVASRAAPPKPLKSSNVSKPPSRPATAPSAKVEDTRRVTRAMTRAPPSTVASNEVKKTAATFRNAPAVTTANKPPTQKMKALNIDDKRGVSKPGAAVGKAPATSTVNKSGPATGRSAPAVTGKSTVAAGVPKKGVQAPPVKGKNTKATSASEKKGGTSAKPEPSDSIGSEEGNGSIPNEKQKEESQEVVKKNKPPKPKAIDDAYMELNGLFSDACRKLSGLRTEWTKTKDEQKDAIPAEVLDDIDSALGKVHLLLGSKLPQFGELLYAYLCTDENSEEKMLASDLQGWWDVAYIQVDSVYRIFEGLSTLRSKNWNKVEPAPPPPSDRKSAEGSAFKPPQRTISKVKPAVKGRANEGLKAFLANKRKQIKSDSDIPSGSDTQQGTAEAMDVSFTSRPATAPTTTNSVELAAHATTEKANLSLNLESSLNLSDERNANRNFEGGFFTISSPVVTTPNSSSVRRRKQSSSFTSIDECGGTPLRSAVPKSLLTPNRLHRPSGASSEVSLRRQSLSVLGVRRSMGSLGKLGVVDIFVENKPQENMSTLTETIVI